MFGQNTFYLVSTLTLKLPQYIIDTLKKQYFDVEVVNNDEYEDGVYFQINGKEVTVGVMVSLEKLNDGDINTLKNYLIKDGLVQGV